ncbi:MAG: shikimate kinase [Acidobacteriota bacterium]
MRLYLCGFMGAGKTTVGRLVAAELGCGFLDLDDRVEAAAGMPVAEIFERWGETYFRDLEHACLGRTRAEGGAVIATGGGTMTFERNLRLLSRLGTTLWLDVDFEDLLDRLDGAGRARRPLFRDEAKARRLFRSRLPAYARADLRIRVGRDATSRDVAANILDLIRATSCDT